MELGGLDAAANPLGVPLSGLPATAVTKGYHLFAMPGNRARIVTDWLLDVLLPTQAVQLGLVRGGQVPLGPERAWPCTASRPQARDPGRGRRAACVRDERDGEEAADEEQVPAKGHRRRGGDAAAR